MFLIEWHADDIDFLFCHSQGMIISVKLKLKIYHDLEILPKIGNFELIIKCYGTKYFNITRKSF